MLRLTTIIGVIILSICAYSLFQVKYFVQDLRKELASITKAVAQEKEIIHVLNAEWTYLNQPERLRNLAQRYLPLEAMQVAQINKLNGELPIVLAANKAERYLLEQELKVLKTAKVSGYQNNPAHKKLQVQYDKGEELKPRISHAKY